jgi:dihydropyrimidine dehydrogenase (NAD+) subunit PreA
MVQMDDGKEHLTWNEKTQANTIPTTFDDDRAGGKHHFVPTVKDALKHRKKS